MKRALLIVLFFAPFFGTAAAATPQPSPTMRCKALENIDLSAVQDAPTQVRHAKLVEASDGIPSYCQVVGYVSPQVGFELRLPTAHWNGKLLALGSHGWGGRLEGETCDAYVKRGYACAVSDTGHSGRGDDGLWAAHNLAAQMDFAFRAVHVSTLAAKAVLGHFYVQPMKKSYFVGCSTGGYEGLVEAQRFPWDFDGIIAGAPDMDEAELTMRELWNSHHFQDSSGRPVLDSQQLHLLHQAALAACDKDDGLEDGIISNPKACKFDPTVLLCRSKPGPRCLTQTQIDAVKRIYAGPTLETGVGTPIRGIFPGSELAWDDKDVGLAVVGPLLADGFFKYMVYGASPAWTPTQFNFDADYKRLGMSMLYNNTNPDLRKFKAAGGKLLVYQGWNDIVEMPDAIVDYYETVERTVGGRPATQDFFRLFMVPGMDHCSGGVGAYAVDYLNYLEAWVEQQRAPETLIAAHISDSYLAALPIHSDDAADLTPEQRVSNAAFDLTFPLDPSLPITFTRPIYPYPLFSKYKGNSPARDASSFAPSEPESLVATNSSAGQTLH